MSAKIALFPTHIGNAFEFFKTYIIMFNHTNKDLAWLTKLVLESHGVSQRVHCFKFEM